MRIYIAILKSLSISLFYMYNFISDVSYFVAVVVLLLLLNCLGIITIIKIIVDDTDITDTRNVSMRTVDKKIRHSEQTFPTR